MKNSNITFASLIILGLIFSLTIGCQAEMDEVVDLTIQEENLTAGLRDDITEDTHYEAGMGCIDCHGTVDLHNMNWDPTTNENESILIPHNFTVDYYIDYVSNNTQESAAMDNVDLEGVKKYIALLTE